jgi:hypothetical protein
MVSKNRHNRSEIFGRNAAAVRDRSPEDSAAREFPGTRRAENDVIGLESRRTGGSDALVDQSSTPYVRRATDVRTVTRGTTVGELTVQRGRSIVRFTETGR